MTQGLHGQHILSMDRSIQEVNSEPEGSLIAENSEGQFYELLLMQYSNSAHTHLQQPGWEIPEFGRDSFYLSTSQDFSNSSSD